MNNPYRQIYTELLTEKFELLDYMKRAMKGNNQQRKAYFDRKLALLQFKLEYADGLATKLGMMQYRMNNVDRRVA